MSTITISQWNEFLGRWNDLVAELPAFGDPLDEVEPPYLWRKSDVDTARTAFADTLVSFTEAIRDYWSRQQADDLSNALAYLSAFGEVTIEQFNPPAMFYCATVSIPVVPQLSCTDGEGTNYLWNFGSVLSGLEFDGAIWSLGSLVIDVNVFFGPIEGGVITRMFKPSDVLVNLPLDEAQIASLVGGPSPSFDGDCDTDFDLDTHFGWAIFFDNHPAQLPLRIFCPLL